MALEKITVGYTRFLKMIKYWKKQLDNGENVGINYLNLSKAFDPISYSLVLTNLRVHGFSDQALSLLQRCLCNRFQRSIMNGSFSSLNEATARVPQGSILGDLVVIRFLNDFFLFISKCQLCNYNNIFYKSVKNMQKIENDLQMDFMILQKWIHESHINKL